MNRRMPTPADCVRAFLNLGIDNAVFLRLDVIIPTACQLELLSKLLEVKKKVVFRKKLKESVGRTSGGSHSIRLSFHTNREEMRY